MPSAPPPPCPPKKHQSFSHRQPALQTNLILASPENTIAEVTALLAGPPKIEGLPVCDADKKVRLLSRLSLWCQRCATAGWSLCRVGWLAGGRAGGREPRIACSQVGQTDPSITVYRLASATVVAAAAFCPHPSCPCPRLPARCRSWWAWFPRRT